MDHNNLRNMARFVGGDPEHKVSLMMTDAPMPPPIATQIKIDVSA